MGLWDSVKEFATGGIKSAVGGLLDVGTSWLGNEFIDKPNADIAWQNSKEGSAEQWARSQQAATTAWQREKQAVQRAFDNSYNTYKNRYKITMSDMRRAGLNPILAAGSGFTVSGNPSAPAASAKMAQPQSAQAFQPKGIPRSSTQSGLNISQSKKAEASAMESIEKVAVHRANAGLMSQQEKEVVQKIRVLRQQWHVAAAKFANLQADSYLKVQQTKTSHMQKEVLKRTATAIGFQLKQLEKITNAYRGASGEVLGYINAIMKSIGFSSGIRVNP